MDIPEKTILVVDDSLTVRMQIKDLLEGEGYEVMLAEDGETCLQTLESERPDIILLDIVMPGMSGLDVCNSIKGDDRLKDIPVLILTHVSDTENKVAGLKSGAEDYVTKPFAIEELNARISAILRTKSLQKDLRIARDEAERSAQAKASFLAIMSHEIRTPMSGVLGFTDLLLETDLDDEQRECLGAIKRSGESLLVIINDILDFSKMESSDIDLEETGLDIGQLLDDVCELIRRKLGQKPVQVSYDIGPDIPDILKGDPHRLRQVLINLLGNAAKFTEKGGISTGLRLEKTEGGRVLLHFELRDTGIGISRDNLQTIFELFTQADSSTTRKFGGTGLGLSIARKIARKMGGDCWAESEYGKGSVFHVTGWFGIGDPADISQETGGTSDGRAKAELKKGASILLAEDNPVNQMLARKTIEKMGHTVEVAANGKIAVEMFNKSLTDYNTSYDIILMDMQMPEMDGIEATMAIRRHEEHLGPRSNQKDARIHIPIVAMTANVLDEHREKCIAAGMDDFVTKPIKKEIISEIIQKSMS
ncbi:MAG: response regulator [Thermodesulfobacteriota bacterium]|nr:response regulator [Thermodesulfobacteriota bacterium]